MVFSMRMARKYASFSSVQSRTLRPGASRAAAARAKFAAPCSTSSNFSRIPVGPAMPRNASASVEIDQRQHAVVLLQSDLENARHLEVLQPRHDGVAPAGGGCRVAGIITVTVSPTPTCSW